MSRFTFSVRGASRPVPPHALDLADAGAAAVEAVRYAGVALSLSPAGFLADDEWMIDATDERGLLLLTVIVSLARAPAIRRH